MFLGLAAGWRGWNLGALRKYVTEQRDQMKRKAYHLHTTCLIPPQLSCFLHASRLNLSQVPWELHSN